MTGPDDCLPAIAEALTLRALEQVGKRLVRTDRHRHSYLEARALPVHEAYLLWKPDDTFVDKVLVGHWTLLTALGLPAPEKLADALNGYAHDLLITGTPHDRDELDYRLSRAL